MTFRPGDGVGGLRKSSAVMVKNYVRGQSAVPAGLQATVPALSFPKMSSGPRETRFCADGEFSASIPWAITGALGLRNDPRQNLSGRIAAGAPVKWLLVMRSGCSGDASRRGRGSHAPVLSTAVR
jgi:hypothetical protein